MNSSSLNNYRFPIRRTIPPFEECDFAFAVQSALVGLMLPPLRDLVCDYLFEPFTDLQKGYDPKTKTIRETDKQEYQLTLQFFGLHGFKALENWCWDKKRDAINKFRETISISNLRFRVQQFAERHNILPFNNTLLVNQYRAWMTLTSS
jgi:hypothetical protein